MRYIKKKIYLSDSQKIKLKNALSRQENLTLRIKKYAPPNHEMYLTPTQIARIIRGKEITISKTQLKKNGGFLPFLMPLLAALDTGVASGAAGWGTKKLLDKIAGGGGLKKRTKRKKKRRGKGVLQNWELAMRR